jgi:hypothetical protein
MISDGTVTVCWIARNAKDRLEIVDDDERHGDRVDERCGLDSSSDHKRHDSPAGRIRDAQVQDRQRRILLLLDG